MEQKTTQYLTKWADGTGRPIKELERVITQYIKDFQASIPGKDVAYYEDLARRKLFLEIKGDMNSQAKPIDMIYLGSSGVIETTAAEKEEKLALWKNPETRAQAVFENKVSQGLTDSKGNAIPDGTPLDTRQWFTAPNPEKNIKGSKNPNFGKPLQDSFLRPIVGFGRPAKGGQFRLIAISANNEQAKKEMPTIGSAVRTRLLLKNDKIAFKYVFNTSRRTAYTPIQLPEYPNVTDEVITDILTSAPTEVNPGLANLMTWHEKNADDKGRLVIFEGDVVFIAPEPTANGSIRMIILDSSNLDLNAEGTTVWVPKELAPQVTFGTGSRVVGIARTNLGDAWDRETRQADPSRKVVQLAANAIFAIPAFRVAPEEESVIEGEEVS